jgi:hypothetical protein
MPYKTTQVTFQNKPAYETISREWITPALSTVHGLLKTDNTSENCHCLTTQIFHATDAKQRADVGHNTDTAAIQLDIL